jgi:subtilisin family serine protease
VCSFSTKIRNAQAAGAGAVLVGNNVAGDPTAMASDGTPDQPTVPGYMVSLDQVAPLITVAGNEATIGANLSYFLTSNANIMAGFSSQGPTDVRFRVKPDVVAPGVNVLSSLPHSFCDEPPCFGFKSGTSMASPHLAGSAAVVRGQHPGWSAAEVRSAVVNTAQTGVLKGFADAAPVSDVNIVGTGLENLYAAAGAVVALDPVSLSFGGVPAGSGQTRTLSLTLTNISGSSSSTFALAVSSQPDSVSYSVSPEQVTLEDGESAVVQVSMAAARGAAGSMQQGTLAITEDGTEVAHAVLFTLVK